jgi:hypothetical protein
MKTKQYYVSILLAAKFVNAILNFNSTAETVYRTHREVHLWPCVR